MDTFRKLIFVAAIFTTVVAQVPLCTYKNDEDGLYTCFLSRAGIAPSVDVEISGILDIGKSLDDVEKVSSNSIASEYILNLLFRTFKLLKKLEFFKGDFESLDENRFRDCSRTLEKINLKANSFNTLPGNTFSMCSGLVELDLGVNNIGYVDKNAFFKLENLKILKLNQNNLLNIEPDVFQLLTKLEILDLSGNKLEVFDKTVLAFNKELKYLNIAENNFHTLFKDYFNGLVNLVTLDVTNNQVNAIEREMFDMLKSLQVAKFKGNSCIDKDIDNFDESFINEFQQCIDNYDEQYSTTVLPGNFEYDFVGIGKLILHKLIISKPKN